MKYIDLYNTPDWQELPKHYKLPKHSKKHNYMDGQYNFYYLLHDGVYIAELGIPRHAGKRRLYKSL